MREEWKNIKGYEGLYKISNLGRVKNLKTNKILKLKLRKEPAVKPQNVAEMFSIIKAAFMQRRKTLSNSLTNANIIKNKQEAVEILQSLNINQNARAEELTLEQFAEIANFITNKKEK